MNEIPEVVELLYHQWVVVPPPESWPEYLSKNNPALVRSMYTFYQGLTLGFHLADAFRRI